MPKAKKVRIVQQYNSLEAHPQFDQILEAIVRGDGNAAILSWCNPPVNTTTLYRFRKFRLPRAIRNRAAAPMAMAEALQRKGLLPDTEEVAQIVAATAAVQAADDPLLKRLTVHQEIIDRHLKDDKLKIGAAVALISCDLKGIELYAKLTNRLQAPSTGMNITIVNPQPSTKAEGDGPVVDIGLAD